MSNSYTGFQNQTTFGSEYNSIVFLINQVLSGKHTAALVQVKAVTNSGGVAPVGFVDILPLVNQVDGAGNQTPHGTIGHCPYFRLQGGANAIIIDPQVGDIGLAVFCDRDNSIVISTKAKANPGSGRKFDMADGVYLGGLLNGTPVQYVQFNSTGITINTPSNVTVIAGGDIDATAGGNINAVASGSANVTAPTIALNGNTTVTGDFTVDGPTQLNGSISQVSGVGGSGATMEGPLGVTNDVTAGAISLISHIHTGVTPGGGTTGGATG